MLPNFGSLIDPKIISISSSPSSQPNTNSAFFDAARADQQERKITVTVDTHSPPRQSRSSKRRRVSRSDVKEREASRLIRPPAVPHLSATRTNGVTFLPPPSPATTPAPSAASTSVVSNSVVSNSFPPPVESADGDPIDGSAALPPSSRPSKANVAENSAFHKIVNICDRERILWTRTKGYPYWPTQIVRFDQHLMQDPRFITALKFKRKSDDVCVMYFGTCQVAWICKSRSTITWQEGINRRLHLEMKQRSTYKTALTEVLAYCSKQRRYPRTWWCEPMNMALASDLSDAWRRNNFETIYKRELKTAQDERVCWVKLRGHPHWPAQVLDDAARKYFPDLPPDFDTNNNMSNQWPCMFFGTGDVAMASSNCITPFSTGIRKKFIANCKRYDFFVSLGEVWGYVQKKRVWPSGFISGRQWWNHPSLQSDSSSPPQLEIVDKPKYETIRRSAYAVDVGKPSNSSIQEPVSCTCEPMKEDIPGMLYCKDDTCLNVASRFWCDPKNCPAGERCANVPFYMRKSPRLTPFYTSDERGWGLRVDEDVHRGDFIIGYVGEILDLKELERRLQQAQRQGKRKNYIMDLGKEQFVDAERRGNKSRFINSSCDPNCDAQKWMDTGRGQTHVGIFAMQDIKEGSEITFNYFQDFVLTGKQDEMTFECKCGADTCCMINPEDRDWIMSTIGRRINVKWDDGWYLGTVESYNAEKKKFKIAYDDGDVEQLALGLAIKQGGKKSGIKFRFMKSEN